MLEEKKCHCEEMTCVKGCTRKHTCHAYWCEKCQPERYQDKEEKNRCEHNWTIVSSWGVKHFFERRQCKNCKLTQDREMTNEGWEESPELVLSESASTPKEDWKEFEYMIDSFYNDVVETVIRYIKGKGYGQEPSEFLKEQLGHWEENFKRYASSRDSLLSSYKQELAEKIEKHDYIRDMNVARYRNQILAIVKMSLPDNT